MAGNYNEHQIPSYFFKHRFLINIIHWWNFFILQRNWFISKQIKLALNSKKPLQILDVGCGDGQFLFSTVKNFPQHQYEGIDRSENNVAFCNHYLKKPLCVLGDLELRPLQKKYDVQYLFGVLQYIQDDTAALAHLQEHLSPDGKIIAYVPINGKSVLPFFERILSKFNHYEVVQNRQRIYSEKQLLQTIDRANLKVQSKQHCIGTLGIIAHEIYALFLAILSKSPYPIISVLLTIYVLYPLIPILFLLNLIDHFREKKDGNGMLLELSKK